VIALDFAAGIRSGCPPGSSAPRAARLGVRTSAWLDRSTCSSARSPDVRLARALHVQLSSESGFSPGSSAPRAAQLGVRMSTWLERSTFSSARSPDVRLARSLQVQLSPESLDVRLARALHVQLRKSPAHRANLVSSTCSPTHSAWTPELLFSKVPIFGVSTSKIFAQIAQDGRTLVGQ